MTLAKEIGSIALAGSILTGLPETAEAGGSVEVMSGNAGTSVDTIISEPLNPSAEFNIYNRNRINFSYDGKHGFNSLLSFFYQLGDGVSALAVGQLSLNGPAAGAGVQYFGRWNDFSTFALATGNYSAAGAGVGTLLTLRFVPEIADDWKLVTQVEAAGSFGKEGHNLSAQRNRLGLGIRGIEFGLAGDITEIGKEPAIAYNVGTFFKKNF